MIETWESSLHKHKRNVYGQDLSIQLSRPVLTGERQLITGKSFWMGASQLLFRTEHLLESAGSGLDLKHHRWLVALLELVRGGCGNLELTVVYLGLFRTYCVPIP